MPKTNAIAEPDLLWAASFSARSMMSITLCGATDATKCSSELKAPVPNKPSRPIRRITVGRNASRALNATCCASPVQSSARNRLPACLKASSHSGPLSLTGLPGGEPVRGGVVVSVVAVDKGEGADFCLRRPFPPTACKQPHRRADCGRDDRQIRAELALDVRDLGDPAAEFLDRAGELLTLKLDVAADLLRRSSVVNGHRSSRPPSSASLLRSPAPASEASPCRSSSSRGSRAAR